MLSNHLILCLLPSVFPSIRVFSNESALHIKWPKYWSFSFSISPSNKYLGFISFRIDWFDLLAVRGVLKSLLQHHTLKASSLQCFRLLFGPTVTSLHDYWKNHRLTRRTFAGEVMSLLFNMLSRLVNLERWTPQVGRCPICYWRSVEKWLQKEWRDGAKAKTTPSWGCDCWWKQCPML